MSPGEGGVQATVPVLHQVGLVSPWVATDAALQYLSPPAPTSETPGETNQDWRPIPHVESVVGIEVRGDGAQVLHLDRALGGLAVPRVRPMPFIGWRTTAAWVGEVIGVNYFCPLATTIFPYQRQLPHSVLVTSPRASGELLGGGGRSPEPEGSSPEAVAAGRGRSVASSSAG